MFHEFHFPISPVAKGRGRITTIGGHPRIITPPETREAEANLKALLSQEWGFKQPLAGPLEVTVTLSILRPKSVKADKRPFVTTRPDIDNYLKLVFDAANKLVWRDDAQIFSLRALKQYSEAESIYFSVREFVIPTTQ